ncbi:MAG: class I SAM-dependent methyltransferase [Pseudohongiellaceae bacterium]
MNIYDRYLLPTLIHMACNADPVRKQRETVVPRATGRVLEVGLGSGINLNYYDPAKVEMVWGLEPSEGMRKKALPRIASAPVKVQLLELPGEEIPLEDESVDTVVLTYTLCSIGPWQKALEQMRRVLKPDGRLLFCEHGEAPDENVRRWQSRINPVWKKLAGGCNLHRPIPRLLTEGGFRIDSMDAMYLPATPKLVGYEYRGVATKP